MSKWISVEDELPENNHDVIVWNYDCGMCGYYVSKTQKWMGYTAYESEEVYVTHWQPLPEPPGGDKVSIASE